MTTERATEIGEYLLGTCQSLEAACEICAKCSPEDLTPEELAEIDEIAMTCEVCGWYVEPSMLDLAQTCEDCRD